MSIGIPCYPRFDDDYIYLTYDDKSKYDEIVEYIKYAPDVKDYFFGEYDYAHPCCSQNTKTKLYIVAYRELMHDRIEGEVSENDPSTINEIDEKNEYDRVVGEYFLHAYMSRYQGKKVIIDIKEVK